ncbi:NAD(P)H-hydrate dehydratase [Candidatus Marsarchaeota archaeon]|nr:NAD(P)H-hydrate dehydratase [Candidatus Marsarchaeota archaeon]
MQSLKEFVNCTKKSMSVADTFALRANALALGMGESARVEGAGFAVAEEIGRSYGGKKIAVVCGTGGKGSIGLVAARHLLKYCDVLAFLIGDPSKIRNDSAQFNYSMLNGIVDVEEIGEQSMMRLQAGLKKADLVVDALIGCGLRGRLSSLFINTISSMNKFGKDIVSVDIPSGIDADTGLPNVAYVKAHHTYCLHKMKTGLIKSKFAGSVRVIDIGIPITAEVLAGPGDVMLATEPRIADANKLSHGRVLIIGGTAFSGGAELAGFGSSNAMAALLTGTGYVTLALPKGPAEIARSKVAAPIVVDVDWKDVAKCMATLANVKHDSLVVGPGMVPDEHSKEMMKRILKMETAAGKRIVVDAGAIRCLAGQKKLLGKNVVITPHDSEFRALAGVATANRTLTERAKNAMKFAKDSGCIVLLKGHETIVTDGNLIKINRAKSSALATMGTGDVLSGMLGAYAALHKNLFESAVAAAYVHSAIGDRLYAERGLHISAEDVVAAIPSVLKEFDKVT